MGIDSVEHGNLGVSLPCMGVTAWVWWNDSESDVIVCILVWSIGWVGWFVHFWWSVFCRSLLTWVATCCE